MSAFGVIVDIDQPWFIDIDTTKAAAAWRRFVACISALPGQAALAEARLASRC